MLIVIVIVIILFIFFIGSVLLTLQIINGYFQEIYVREERPELLDVSLPLGNLVRLENQIDKTIFLELQEVIDDKYRVLDPLDSMENGSFLWEQFKKTFEVLNESELQTIEDLLNQLTKSKESFPLIIRVQLESLMKCRNRYKDLSARMNIVHQGLLEKNKQLIEDQLISLSDVEAPILLVKQYKLRQQWHAIPYCSHVTDKNALFNWLKNNPIHPISKELIIKPTPYHGFSTRYRWHDLTEGYCSSQELRETVCQARDLLFKLSNHLATHQNLAHSSLSPQSLFHQSHDDSIIRTEIESDDIKYSADLL